MSDNNDQPTWVVHVPIKEYTPRQKAALTYIAVSSLLGTYALVHYAMLAIGRKIMGRE